MGSRRQRPGGAASASASHDEERLARQVREQVSKYHKGKREAAMRQLEGLDSAHPSGLACLALCKLQVLQGVREAVKAGDEEQCERALLLHLHSAAAHAVRGAAQHRSLGCLRTAAHVLLACRGRGAATERVGLWQQLAAAFPGGLPRGLEGWADPAAEDLPADLPTDRWPHEYGPLACRARGYTPARFAREAADEMRSVQAACQEEDVVTAHAGPTRVTIVGMAPAAHAADNVARDTYFPEGPRRDLSAALAAMRASARSAARAPGGPMPPPASQGSQGAEADRGDRLKARPAGARGAAGKERELRARREELRREAERGAKSKQLEEARSRANKLKTYLLARVGDRQGGQGRWEALCSEASLPMAEYEAALGELQQRGALAPEQASRAQLAARLMARGATVYYRLPGPLAHREPGSAAAGQPADAQQLQPVQQGQECGAPPQAGCGVPQQPAAGGAVPAGEDEAGAGVTGLLSFEQAERQLAEAALMGFSWEEQRREFAAAMPVWGPVFEHALRPEPAAAKVDDLLVFREAVPSPDSLEVEARQGDLEALLGAPGACFVLPASQEDPHAATGAPGMRQRMREMAQAGGGQGAEATALDLLYHDLTLCSSRTGSAIPGIPPEPAVHESVPGLLPHISQQQAKHLLAQCLLGHCMLREARAGGREGGAALGTAARLREARELASKQSMGKLVALAAEDNGAADRAVDRILALCTHARQAANWPAMERRRVEVCAQLSLALAPRPAGADGQPEEGAVLEVKRRVAGDVLLGLRLLQRSGRLQLSVADRLLEVLEGAGAAARLPGHGPSVEPSAGQGCSKPSDQQGSSEPLAGQGSGGRPVLVAWALQAAPSPGAAAEGDPAATAAQRAAARALRALGRLALPDLMRAHAFLCLLLTWHFPEAQPSHKLQEACRVLETACIACDVTKDDIIRITPCGLDLVASQELAAAAALEAGQGPQAAQALLLKPSAGSASKAAASALEGDGQQLLQHAAGLAASACGVGRCAVDLELLSGRAAPGAGAGAGEGSSGAEGIPEEAQADAVRGCLQRLAAVRALVSAQVRHGQQAFARAAELSRELSRLSLEAPLEGQGMLVVLAQLPEEAQARLASATEVTRSALLEAQGLQSLEATLSHLGEACHNRRLLANAQALLQRAKASAAASQLGSEGAKLASACEQLQQHLNISQYTIHFVTAGLDPSKRELGRESSSHLDRAEEQLQGCLLALGRLKQEDGDGLSPGEAAHLAQEARQAFAAVADLARTAADHILGALLKLCSFAEALFVWESRVASMLLHECCAHACAEDVGPALLHHVLPTKWEAHMRQQEEAAAAGAPAGPEGAEKRSAADAAAAALLEQEAKAKQARLEKEQRQEQRALLKAQQRAALLMAGGTYSPASVLSLSDTESTKPSSRASSVRSEEHLPSAPAEKILEEGRQAQQPQQTLQPGPPAQAGAVASARPPDPDAAASPAAEEASGAVPGCGRDVAAARCSWSAEKELEAQMQVARARGLLGRDGEINISKLEEAAPEQPTGASAAQRQLPSTAVWGSPARAQLAAGAAGQRQQAAPAQPAAGAAQREPPVPAQTAAGAAQLAPPVPAKQAATVVQRQHPMPAASITAPLVHQQQSVTSVRPAASTQRQQAEPVQPTRPPEGRPAQPAWPGRVCPATGSPVKAPAANADATLLPSAPRSSPADHGATGAAWGLGRPPPPPPPPMQGPMRFIRWEGDWVCRCGRINPLRDDCKACSQWAPCRQWFRSACQKQDCAFPHLPFDLPAAKPPTNEQGLTAKGMPIAQPLPQTRSRLDASAPAFVPSMPKVQPPLATRQPQQAQQQQQQQAQQQQGCLPSAALPARHPATQGQEAQVAQRKLPGPQGGEGSSQPAAVAAVAASPAAAAAAAAAGAAVAGDGSPLPGRAASGGAQQALEAGSVGMDQVRPTLANAAGEYNCFLNVIIQCLWHCADFRQQVSAWPAALYSGNAVLCALRNLFLAFTEEEGEGLRNRTVAAGSRQPVNPTPLREALAALPQGHLFRQGEMSDAAEVLDAMYGQIRLAAAAQGLPSGVDELFGLGVREAVDCSACHRTTHQASYTQFFFNTQATAIRMFSAGEGGGPVPSLGRLLRLIEQQARKTCDTDVGGCGALNPITHCLQHAPRVFTLQLAWESHHEEGADIDATLAAIGEQVDLGELFQAQELGQHVYRLRSMVCYYGAHYQAFVLVPQLNRWLMFDDTRVANVGAWEDVRLKCSRGRLQPSALFYETIQPNECSSC